MQKNFLAKLTKMLRHQNRLWQMQEKERGALDPQRNPFSSSGHSLPHTLKSEPKEETRGSSKDISKQATLIFHSTTPRTNPLYSSLGPRNHLYVFVDITDFNVSKTFSLLPKPVLSVSHPPSIRTQTLHRWHMLHSDIACDYLTHFFTTSGFGLAPVVLWPLQLSFSLSLMFYLSDVSMTGNGFTKCCYIYTFEHCRECH